MAKTAARKRSAAATRTRSQPGRDGTTPAKKRPSTPPEQPLAARLQAQQAALVSLAKHEAIQRGDLQRVYQTITEMAARTNDVGRASIWLYNQDRSGIVLQDLFELETGRHSDGTVLHARDFPAYFSALQREEYAIAASDAHTDPRTSEFSGSYLKPLGIGAMLDAPIRHKGRIVGVLCEEHVGGSRTWSAEEIAYTSSLAAMVTLALDIAERVQVEEALRRSQDELEQRIKDRTAELTKTVASLWQERAFSDALLESLPGVIYLYDKNGRFLQWNKNFERVTGYTNDEIARMHPLDFFSWPDKELVAARIQEGLLKGAAYVEADFVAKDGTRTPYYFTGVAIQFKGTRCLIGMGIDITTRKQAEERLQESEERTRSIVESALDGVITMDAKGLITGWNPQAERIFGYAPAEAIGQDLATTIIPPQHREAHRHGLQRILDAGHGPILGKRIEITALRRDGHEFPVELTVAPMKVSGEIHFSAFVNDITERKQLEESRLAKLSADRANQAKSEFLSRMSHELRTPLNAVMGFAQLLEMEALSSEQQEHIQHILKGGRHLLALINEVLDIARIEAGSMTFSLEPVAVSVVLKEAVDLVRPQAAARHIQLVTPASQETPVYVWAEQQRLKQVLLNLLSNGVKYNREGGTLTVSCDAAPGNRYRLTVTDTGGGIPPALLSRLFTPFDRLEADSRIEGTGLGLVLSRSLITAMGGTISVNSVVGQGTSFSIDLPLSGPPAARTPARSDKVEVTVPVSGRTVTVLYIEDNQSNYQLVERLVEKRQGVKLIGAMQGKLGVELAVAHRPDLILLDLNLPDIQGDEVLLRLREHPETAAIPVVMLSADAMQKQIDKLLAAGAQAYLTKPIDVTQFYALLDKLMTRKGER